MTRYNVSSQKVMPNSLLCISVLVMVALVVVEVVVDADLVEDMEHRKYPMLLVTTEGKELAVGQVAAVTREEQ